jgi:hypothetical protein
MGGSVAPVRQHHARQHHLQLLCALLGAWSASLFFCRHFVRVMMAHIGADRHLGTLKVDIRVRVQTRARLLPALKVDIRVRVQTRARLLPALKVDIQVRVQTRIRTRTRTPSRGWL